MGEGALLVTGGARVREMRKSEARRGARISLSLSSIFILLSNLLYYYYYYCLYLAFHPLFFLAKGARHRAGELRASPDAGTPSLAL